MGRQRGLGQCIRLGQGSWGLSGLSANAHARTRTSKVETGQTLHHYTAPDSAVCTTRLVSLQPPAPANLPQQASDATRPPSGPGDAPTPSPSLTPCLPAKPGTSPLGPTRQVGAACILEGAGVGPWGGPSPGRRGLGAQPTRSWWPLPRAACCPPLLAARGPPGGEGQVRQCASAGRERWGVGVQGAEPGRGGNG